MITRKYRLQYTLWFMAVTVAGFLVVVQASKDESYLPTSSSVLSSTSPSSTSPLVESSTAESTIRWLVTGPSPPDTGAQIGQGDNNIFSSEEPTTVPQDDVSGFNRFDVLFLGVLCCSMLLGACDYVYRCYFGPDEEKLKERREKQRRQDTIRFFQQRNARLQLTKEHLKKDEVVVPSPLVQLGNVVDLNETLTTCDEKSAEDRCDEEEIYEDIEVGLDGCLQMETISHTSEEDTIETIAHEDNEVNVIVDIDGGEFQEDVEVSLGVLTIPGRTKPVSNTCAICLEPYQEGEFVVWSTNNSCQHVYHENCAVDYIINFKYRGNDYQSRPQHKSAPCPVCRQPFDEISPTKRKNKKEKRDGQ